MITTALAWWQMALYCAGKVAFYQLPSQHLGDITVAIFVIMAISIFIIFYPALPWSTWSLWCSQRVEGIWQVVDDNDCEAKCKFNKHWMNCNFFQNTPDFILLMNSADWYEAGSLKIIVTVIMVLVLFIIFYIYNNDINNNNSVFSFTVLCSIHWGFFFSNNKKGKQVSLTQILSPELLKDHKLFHDVFWRGLSCNSTDVFSLGQETWDLRDSGQNVV